MPRRSLIAVIALLLPSITRAQAPADLFIRSLSDIRQTTAEILTRAAFPAPLSDVPLTEAEKIRAFKLVWRHLKGGKVSYDFAADAFQRAELEPNSLAYYKRQAARKAAKKNKGDAEAPKATYESTYQAAYMKPLYIDGGVEFHRDHKKEVDAVAKRYQIDPLLLVTIVGVETAYGKEPYTAKAFNALLTMLVRVPGHKKLAGQLAALLKIAAEQNVDPHDFGGSRCGAFGYGQFMPQTFFAYAVDFDRNGVRSPYEWPDVLASVANLLTVNGYKGARFSPTPENLHAIFGYNNSDWYVRAVVELREHIARALPREERPR